MKVSALQSAFPHHAMPFITQPILPGIFSVLTAHQVLATALERGSSLRGDEGTLSHTGCGSPDSFTASHLLTSEGLSCPPALAAVSLSSAACRILLATCLHRLCSSFPPTTVSGRARVSPCFPVAPRSVPPTEQPRGAFVFGRGHQCHCFFHGSLTKIVTESHGFHHLAALYKEFSRNFSILWDEET